MGLMELTTSMSVSEAMHQLFIYKKIVVRQVWLKLGQDLAVFYEKVISYLVIWLLEEYIQEKNNCLFGYLVIWLFEDKNIKVLIKNCLFVCLFGYYNSILV